MVAVVGDADAILSPMNDGIGSASFVIYYTFLALWAALACLAVQSFGEKSDESGDGGNWAHFLLLRGGGPVVFIMLSNDQRAVLAHCGLLLGRLKVL